MKKQILLFLTTLLSFNCYSQISFEKGYYIDNNNQKINCLIKNIDWRNNPIEFKYKLSENSNPIKKTLKSVKEFGINNFSKYVRRSVKIDISSDNINSLSHDKRPVFEEKELFLKILVEGKATLYEYVNENLKRYFYKNDSNIEQLIFKRYETTNNKIGKNYRFKRQLWNELKCPNFKMSKIESLEYKRSDLVDFFVDYNNCNNQEYTNFEKKQKGDLFNLTIRPRLNSSSLVIRNSISSFENANFGNKTGFGLGVEAEFILPFNKNKWSITVEPTYQSFKSEKTTESSTIVGGVLIANVDYSSIEIPIGLRHYFFLNQNSRIFMNASYIFDLGLKSSIDFTRNDGTNFNSLEIEPINNLAFGLGYKYNNKYSIELRYQTPRKILGNYLFWRSKYKKLSIVFGYTIF